METILFACVHNSGRSQFAASFFNSIVHPNKARAISAGTQPGSHVHPEVIQVMQELGMDLSHEKPQLLTNEIAQSANLLITMGCGESCPLVPGLERQDWPLEDPKGKPIERVREIRDEVRLRVQHLIETRGWNRP